MARSSPSHSPPPARARTCTTITLANGEKFTPDPTRPLQVVWEDENPMQAFYADRSPPELVVPPAGLAMGKPGDRQRAMTTHSGGVPPAAGAVW
ncbi:hypothetical protein B0H17DRAFT_1214958 [Mycena rosella]|uniref:Uncharacterized protein n=1 Tax=Mycena rosella TaxID=1033263 RepID=A0AAD7CLX5_MYCRO|nr:hypothetical protein B0H17DRAFT_1214958 [Mycena rosella]